VTGRFIFRVKTYWAAEGNKGPSSTMEKRAGYTFGKHRTMTTAQLCQLAVANDIGQAACSTAMMSHRASSSRGSFKPAARRQHVPSTVLRSPGEASSSFSRCIARDQFISDARILAHCLYSSRDGPEVSGSCPEVRTQPQGIMLGT